MSRRALQALCGLAAGVGARSLLPGHHPDSLLLTALLSLLGAATGGAAGELWLAIDVAEAGGCVLSALGALVMLLIHAMVTA